MDLDDSFTEGLIQRARARREYLHKQKADFGPVGKKRAVLVDENQVNTDEPPNKSPKCESVQTLQTAYSQNKENAEVQNKDSDSQFVPVLSSKPRGLAALRSNCSGNEPYELPQRQSAQSLQTTYFADEERAVMPNENSNTSFVPDLSVSRARGLQALKSNCFRREDDSNLYAASEVQVNKCNSYVFSTNSRELCSGQKSDLACVTADIRMSENGTCGPTVLSKNGALSNPISRANTSSMKVFNSEENSSSGSFLVSMLSKGGLQTQSSTKQGDIEVNVGGRSDKRRVWDKAVEATLGNSVSLTNSGKRETKTWCNTKKSECALDNQDNNDECLHEDNFAEKYSSIKSDNNCKIGLGCSPLKQTKEDLKPHSQTSEEAKKRPSPVVPDSIMTDVDPIELPLSARKALFEKAIMNGAPKVKKDITDHTLTVAERAAMFESALKGNFQPKRTNFPNSSHFKELKCRTDLSVSDKHIPENPVKTAQHGFNGHPEIVKASPSKEIVAPSFPPKHIGFFKQAESDSSCQEKTVVTQVSGVQKKEISSLVHHWEEMSSSSEKNSSNEERKDLVSDGDTSWESDDAKETSESVCNEAENAVCDDEQKDEEADMAENVFYPPVSEKVSLKSDEDVQSMCERKDHPTSNIEVMRSSPSYSGISSSTDNSSYCASGSYSCSSGSSVRSYDDMQEMTENRYEKTPEAPLLYTVSFYRKQKQETRLTPVQTIVRGKKDHDSSPPVSSNTGCTEHIQERIKALQDEILRQQTIISQTSQALNLCSSTTEFSGSMEQVEGEKLLLVSTQRRQACLNEVTRLKSMVIQGEDVTDSKGTLTITDLQLPLKREFITSQLEGKGNDSVHYFLCLIRHGAQVIVTQMMSTDDKTTDGALCFTNLIQLQNLPADFSVIFEVYALQTKKEVLSHEKKYHIKREHSKIRLTPKGKKGDAKFLNPAMSSPGGPSAVRSSSFGVVGYTRFTLLNCNKKTFTLDKVPFTSPLEGVLRVKLQLHAEHKVMEKGFLTMFEDVSGFGAWHRRWCALDTSQLSYWKYPDDEHKKERIGMIDLKNCITSQVKLVPRDVCARPHTFQLVTIRPQEKGDKNTLISRSMNTLTTTKYLLSADTKEERILWCNKLNEALTSVRKWDPRALKPVEVSQDKKP